jgi:hypothetical protein
MEMVGSHTEKTAGNHNLSDFVMEPQMKRGRGKPEKHVEMRTEDRY